ncbi:hypothetical protein PHISCL_02494 [Aspergillus sclerotialis]|uniref:Uncharacterized protein n=1 Tax=Aspergillus sclerotialis TaxID=2070753 RepID=A0A3A3A5A2_9EURO|nr:hypothetical protein PHISCL_02494 [Aspergillus sclerotialis]
MEPLSQTKENAFPCPAWVFSNNSNVHVAKDRCWFGDDYTPIESFVTDMLGNSIKVVGMGTVNLPTHISPTQTGPDSHGNVCLKNVLHAPTVICDIIGRPILHDYEVNLGDQREHSGFITNSCDGSPTAYFKPSSATVGFLEVQLSEPPSGPELGPSPFDSSALYMIHAFWPDSERTRIAGLLTSRQTKAKHVGPPTSAEKAWLKTHYGNEFKFLRSHGLRIYNKKERAEGRSIIRDMMSKDGMD